MATFGGTVRRGLPRVKGGEAWPAVGDVPLAPATEAVVVDRASVTDDPVVEPQPQTSVAAPGAVGPADASSTSSGTDVVSVRRGLPRVKGGEPWPPAGAVAVASVDSSPRFVSVAGAPSLNDPQSASSPPPVVERAKRDETPQSQTSAPAASGSTVRRGLPRTKGGEPWPPADFAPAPVALVPAVTAPEPAGPAVTAPEPAEPAPEPATAFTTAPAPRRTGLPRPGATPAPAPKEAAAAVAIVEPAEPAAPLAPLPSPRTVFPGAAAVRWNADRRTNTAPITAPEPERVGPFTKLQWAGAVIVGGAALLFAAGMAVLFVRWFLSLTFMQDFLHTYPGAYPLPATAPVGFPAWLNWQHFFNVFFMVLIIRTGLTVRSEKRPSVFWTPKSNPKRKISLTLWFHQSLDLLWIINGVIFVILLFVTGQWMRLIPTSWSVFPNAISAALQYVSLDWPTEDGWVNYNSLQQLAYFATVFIAAPLAIATGVRMSGVWPKNAKRLSQAYPVEWARAVHFPTMIYFVLFIIVHVTLVFATGALRNLNHMYAASDAVNWVGFWIFVASLVVIAAAWVAARPLVLAPIARLFGKVSGR